MITSTPQDTPRFEQLLGDGSARGLNLQYAVQPSPDGLAQTFIIGRDFVGKDPSALVLGDNVFYGRDFPIQLANAAKRTEDASVFAYHVRDPERYGAEEFDAKGRAISLEEKHFLNPKSNPEEIAYHQGFIDAAQLEKLAAPLIKSGYGEYLMQVRGEQIQP